MVKTRHAPAPRSVDFQHPSSDQVEVEILRASELLRRVGAERLASTERPSFHLVTLYLAGETRHMVDFEPHPCRRGTVITVRPGQLQRWSLKPGVEAYLLLFTSTFLFPNRPRGGSIWSERFFDDADWPTALQLGGADLRAVEHWFQTLEHTYPSVSSSALDRELLRHLVSVVLLDLARRGQVTGTAAAGSPPLQVQRVHRFKKAIDRSFRVTRAVGDYAKHLGCAPKTLDRASRELLGAPAKEVIDARVALEARRMLAHTTQTVAAIGEGLGFSEATNFVKFFKSRVGCLPGEFRERARFPKL